MTAQRIVRTPLPVDVIREMDETILSGAGGYETRAEFITDAIRERLLELKYEESIAPGDVGVRRSSGIVSDLSVSIAEPRLHAQLGDTAIGHVLSGHVVEEGFDSPAAEPLFGLHNRDYPSLWALRFLADLTHEGAIPLHDFESAVCKEAWEFGTTLQALERVTAQKLTGLFPTNHEKKDASESAFVIFAIGDHRVTGGFLRTTGPLYQWGVTRVLEGVDGLLVGVTREGWRLLASLEGLTAAAPHDRRHAEVFFEHLRSHAQGDWWGFDRVIHAVHRGRATRKDLIEDLGEGPYDWSANELSTNAAGYVARAREWGLLTPKQDGGRYVLTEFGNEIAAMGKGNKQ